MAHIGFSQRRTLAYLYGWTLVLALVALALRFVPYSDDRGHFDAGWTIFMALCLAGALAASVYLVSVLEILKLRNVRLQQLVGPRRAGRAAPETEAEDEAGVQRELDTGTFAAVDPSDAARSTRRSIRPHGSGEIAAGSLLRPQSATIIASPPA